ncbi:MAG: dTDP-4-dehydrorhamnose reductase [Burkholderiales bacterium]
MKILLTGRNGQVGWELERALAPLGEVVATDRSTLDLADPDAIQRVVREVKPDIIVNAAAYTAVDKAESEPELAMRINGFVPGVFAEEAKRLGALLVHYSTDYVFDGEKAGPYLEDDEPNPINAYGKSKLAGEQAVLNSGCLSLVLRTSWVYGGRGANFLLTVLRLARERSELRVVNDQFGAPTWCRAIARSSAGIVRRMLGERLPSGVYHVTNRGRTSWFGFATEALRQTHSETPVRAIPSSEYPTPAKRPTNSVLDGEKLERVFGMVLPDWRESLEECLVGLDTGH